MIKTVIVALVIFLISMLAGIIYLGVDGIRSGYGFWKLTLRFIIMLYIMKAFDLLTCLYVETLSELGCPEVCPAVCIQDDISFGNMKNGL